MKNLGLFLLLAGSSAMAAKGYDLKMDLTMNGKHMSSPRVLVKAGEKATIAQEGKNGGSFIEVVATEGEVQGNAGIMMSFTVGTIDKKGARTIVSRPKILAVENSEARITVGENENSVEQISLTVTPKRVDL